MKIAFFHELHKGGARRSSNEFAKELISKGHKVDLFLSDEFYLKSDEDYYSDIKFFKFVPRIWKGKDWKTRLYKDSVELFQLRKFHKHIAEKLDEGNYDVALVFPSKLTQAPFILEFLKTKKIYFAMEPLRLVYDPKQKIPNEFKLSRKTYEKVNRFVRKKIDYRNVSFVKLMIANSIYSANWSKGIYKKKVEVVYLGVNTTFFTDVSKQKDIDVLYVGSADLLTGYDTFLEIKKSLDKNTTVREILFEKEWLTDVQLRDLYRRSKILVSTSLNEPLGMIPLEAMSCGSVTLALNEGGYKETTVDGKNGFLVSSVDEFAEKIRDLLGNKEKLSTMSELAIKNTKKNWSWEATTKNLIKILENY
jgi:glycosyltransferase involved in cell wall biosynthesis